MTRLATEKEEESIPKAKQIRDYGLRDSIYLHAVCSGITRCDYPQFRPTVPR